jgi:hypothetical protein
MKKILLMVLAMVFITSLSYGANLALKATWTANTDAATGYKLYRTDGTRILIGTIPGRATTQYLFNVAVPDGSTGTLTFVMTATSATKESPDSAVASYFFDLTPALTAPVGVGVSPQ